MKRNKVSSSEFHESLGYPTDKKFRKIINSADLKYKGFDMFAFYKDLLSDVEKLREEIIHLNGTLPDE
jgi:hypothetical protein